MRVKSSGLTVASVAGRERKVKKGMKRAATLLSIKQVPSSYMAQR